MNRAKNGIHSDTPLTLGIDLGSGSVGWSLIAGDGPSRRIVALGVRRFDAGVSGDIDGGRDESNAAERRSKRGPRRQTWRRQWRLRNVYRCLQRHGLLPESDDDSSDARHSLLSSLDADLMKTQGSVSHVDMQLLPYRLRTAALDRPLSPFEFGRVVYHIAQRRGFLSNKKAGKNDEEQGKVKQGISELDQEIRRKGARTLGEYFAMINPHEDKLRRRWTARSMFLNEFEAICSSQVTHLPQLTDAAKAEIRNALFHQRPLKSQSGLIGRCELEPRRRRAPLACLQSQRIRMLQMVNDLQLTSPDGEIRKLTQEERLRLVKELNSVGDLSWAKVLKTIGLRNTKAALHKWEFNFEEGGRKGVLGNRTGAKMIEAMGDLWSKLSSERQSDLVDTILQFDSEGALAKHLALHWQFSHEISLALSQVEFEQGYHSLSRRAIRKLLPHLESGIPLATARKTVYGDQLLAAQELEQLPPLRIALPSLRNPAVARALSELRKVVNAIIRCYGKPSRIRVELGRDLKHSRDRRKSMSEAMRENEAVRQRAAQRLRTVGFRDTPTNILKIRLAEECGWVCPYTERSFGMTDLVGDNPQFDIEHIIPLSRSLDNSFGNKTICYHEENRQRKRNRTPWEAYGGTETFNQILQRVRTFKGPRKAVAAKLERFMQQEIDASEFISKQLNDTRYMSCLAADYLGLLFGGRIDQAGKRRIETPSGGVTGYLRKYWGLNSVLGDPDDKNRADHRHHAIDAVVIALSDASAVRDLSHAAEVAEETRSGLFARIEPPWANLVGDVRDLISNVIVSSRVSRRLNGPLHKETILSKPKPVTDDSGRRVLGANGEPIMCHHVRVLVSQLTLTDVEENIVDPVVRKIIKEQLARLGGTPDKAFKEQSNHPYLSAKDGRSIPIHKVRIRKSDKPILVGRGSGERFVNAGSNHHMEVIALLDKDGHEMKWSGHIVSRFDAMQRKCRGEQIIQRDHGPGKLFKFSIAPSEYLMMKRDGEHEDLYRVESISGQNFEMVLHTDARPTSVRRNTAGARIRPSVSTLKELQARKVTVSPLGDVLPAND